MGRVCVRLLSEGNFGGRGKEGRDGAYPVRQGQRRGVEGGDVQQKPVGPRPRHEAHCQR